MAIGQKTDLKFITEADGIKLPPGPHRDGSGHQGHPPRGCLCRRRRETGPWIAIGAVAAGREAATSIDRYLEGKDLKAGRDLPVRPIPKEEGHWNPVPGRCPEKATGLHGHHTVEEWIKGFKEINLGYSEEAAVEEAARCINCGICSECMQCAQACQAKAVAHDLGPEKLELEVGAVILAAGFKTYDPRR